MPTFPTFFVHFPHEEFWSSLLVAIFHLQPRGLGECNGLGGGAWRQSLQYGSCTDHRRSSKTGNISPTPSWRNILIYTPCRAGWEGSCLATSQSSCAAKGIAHVSCHTSNWVRPWMLTWSNCIKLYLTSRVLHPILPITYVVSCRLAPRARPRLCGKTAGPATPPLHASPQRSEGMQRFGGRSLETKPPIWPK